MSPRRVVIAGGSLGGLTAGLLLRDLGLDVTIHERSPAELEQRGAGIGFLPDSYRYLVDRAGVALDDISVSTSRIRYLDRGGEVIHDQAHTVPVQLVEHGVSTATRLFRPRPLPARM